MTSLSNNQIRFLRSLPETIQARKLVLSYHKDNHDKDATSFKECIPCKTRFGECLVMWHPKELDGVRRSLFHQLYPWWTRLQLTGGKECSISRIT